MNTTELAAVVLFTVYFIYGIFRIPAIQFLTCLAIGGLAFGLSDSYAIATIALIFAHLLYPYLTASSYPRAFEGFMDAKDPQEISRRVRAMREGTPVDGVGSAMTEGFEDAQQTDMTISENKTESSNSSNAQAASKPASAKEEKAPEKPKEAAPAPTKISEQGVPPVTQPAESFQSQNELFKLGSIPGEDKGGFHIDAGTTVMNALKALKPDQIQAMTNDTKQLIETQKSLMNMLQSFQPMVAEGKQLMTTFQDMFGPAAGSLNTAQNMLNLKS